MHDDGGAPRPQPVGRRSGHLVQRVPDEVRVVREEREADEDVGAGEAGDEAGVRHRCDGAGERRQRRAVHADRQHAERHLEAETGTER